jgi:hypothetical protein
MWTFSQFLGAGVSRYAMAPGISCRQILWDQSGLAVCNLLDDAFLGYCNRSFDRPVNDSLDRYDSLLGLNQNIHNGRSCTPGSNSFVSK